MVREGDLDKGLIGARASLVSMSLGAHHTRQLGFDVLGYLSTDPYSVHSGQFN